MDCIAKENETNKENISVKRGIIISPNHNQSKKVHTDNTAGNTAGTSTRKKLPFDNVDMINISETQSREPIENNCLDISETQYINNREPIENVGLDIFQEINKNCEKLMNKQPATKSVLHSHNFDGMANLLFI